jgi:hypothetical protein
MMKMSKNLAWRLTAVLATAMALGACGGGGNDDVPVAATSVPDSAGASSAAFIAFIQGLAQGDETSEPLTFGAGFTAPPGDETGDPVAL